MSMSEFTRAIARMKPPLEADKAQIFALFASIDANVNRGVDLVTLRGRV